LPDLPAGAIKENNRGLKKTIEVIKKTIAKEKQTRL